MFYTILDETPVGRLLIAGDDEGLRHVQFLKAEDSSNIPVNWEENVKKLREPIRQLKLYFTGKLRQFSLPLAGEGTEFQKKVWAALCDVPFGETASYGEIAAAIRKPTASRAVGMANGRNPISIIVPCHRIIGASGKLVGYGGGLENKKTLLRHEGATGWSI
ncbi:MAG: methylated-DNA--[protein]-cysteine S-methyltransferase [Planctomycetaceae bacterium]|nr:methylated-DNA--[protein]-cysteine S-methyltransferase [Planctomycetaceae bacterium]